MSHFELSASGPDEQRDVMSAMRRGAMCRCPHCGEGKLFGGFLTAVHTCSACGEELDLHRADDLPAYVVVVIVGHIVVFLNLIVERASEWPLWMHFAIWPTLALAMTMVMLRPVKGALIGYQWALRMHGFDPNGDVHASPASGLSSSERRP
jgi:uncharacterized protein (DUF983 family)